MVEIRLSQPLLRRAQAHLRKTFGARKGQGLFRADHQRRSPIPKSGLRQDQTFLHAGRLRVVSVFRALPRQDVRQRGDHPPHVCRAKGYARSVRACAFLPRMRQAHVNEPTRRRHVRPRRRLAPCLRKVRKLYGKAQKRQHSVARARRGHEHARDNQIPVLADSRAKQKSGLRPA